MSRERSASENFAGTVDRLLEEGSWSLISGSDDPLLKVAKLLRQTASPTMIDPRFRAALRQRLLGACGVTELAAGQYAVLESAVGRLHIAYHERVICGVALASDDASFEQQSSARYGRRLIRAAQPPVWLVILVDNHLRGRRAFKGAVG